MPLTPNIILYLEPTALDQLDNLSKEIVLNDMGIIDMTFDRVEDASNTAGLISTLRLTFFDASGYQFMSYIQKTKNRLYMKYGYYDNLSPLFQLDVVKINTSYSDFGVIVSLIAVGTELRIKRQSEVYLEGEHIETILNDIARRNNWKVRKDGKSLISLGGKPIRLHKDIIKPPMYDFDFIKDYLKPLCDKTILSYGDARNYAFFETFLFTEASDTYLVFRPYTDSREFKKVWQYEYGKTPNSQIINMTNQFDLSFLLDGLTIKIPSLASDILAQTEEELRESLRDKVSSFLPTLKELENQYNISLPSLDNYKYNVITYEAEEVDPEDIQNAVVKAIEDAMLTINTLDLEVIGNPAISPLDLVHIQAVHRDGTPMLVSSVKGMVYWRIIKITESINLNGYKTQLKLVRELIK